MPRIIGQNRIARVTIGNRPITQRPGGAGGAFLEPFTFPAPPGGQKVYAFAIPRTGLWKFVAWGAGGGSSTPASSSGAYVEVSRFLAADAVVTITVGAGTHNAAGFASIIDLSAVGGPVATAGGGLANAVGPGTASGGDVNLNGSPPGTPGLGTGGGFGGVNTGGGAPANLPYRGGDGANPGATVGLPGGTPGGGGFWRAGAAQPGQGGSGLVIATLLSQ